MKLVAEYREEAARCRTMAATETNPTTRLIMLQLAQEFDELARRREQTLKSAGKP